MGNSARTRLPIQNRLIKLSKAEFCSDVHVQALVWDFLEQSSFSRDFSLKLLSVGRNKKISWDVRRLAVLMLENQALKLPAAKLEDFDFLFVQLGLKPAPGLNFKLASSVLKEGYSTTELEQFIAEFQQRLQRLNRVHQKIRSGATSGPALRDFIEASRRDCKLTLARYVFTPKEVIDEIIRQLKVTEGLKDLNVFQPQLVDAETRHALNLLPDYESRILAGLCETSNIYWVSETTSCELNSLVEYPAGTVVLVIKPPGSDIEFEIKRAGRRGNQALNVVYARDGYTVPPSHRLDAGSSQGMLRYEANSASRLRLIYRLVHGTEAPVSAYISRSTITAVPSRNGDAQMLDYFTDAQIFGEGFYRMRAAMEESVAAYKSEDGANLPDLPGDLGITAEFLSHVAPTQAILCGTSAFRLDKLAKYLSNDGDELYSKETNTGKGKRSDGKRLADELLEEILGSYRPPKVRCKTYDEYLTAAFSVAENRLRADRIYLSLVQQIAKFWGTMLAIRGHSGGESFVARNVGLKSFFHQGDWQVRIIFMDHDALSIPNADDDHFYPESGIKSMIMDELYIWNRIRPDKLPASELGCLHRIYKVDADLDAQGQVLAHQALKDAYKKTQHELLNNPALRRLFDRRFLERLLIWDRLVDGYFQLNGDGSAVVKWKKAMRRMLDANGLRKGQFDISIEIIENNRQFLARYYELFAAEKRQSMAHAGR